MKGPEAQFEDKEKIRVSRIHFLIHPGFLSDPGTLEKPMKWAELIADGHDYDSIMAELKKWEATLDAYVEEAKKLKEDEMIIVFTHTDREQLKEDLKEGKAYAEKLRELRKILDKRLVVVSGSFNLFHEAGEALEAVRQVAAARGYVFDKQVETEAYGEILEQCVVEGAVALNEAGEFDKKTLVRQKLTDLGQQSLSEQEVIKAKHREMYPQIFDNLEFD